MKLRDLVKDHEEVIFNFKNEKNHDHITKY